jgi:hypothetical protein
MTFREIVGLSSSEILPEGLDLVGGLIIWEGLAGFYDYSIC